MVEWLHDLSRLGAPQQGDNIKSCSISLAFSGVQKRAEWLDKPCRGVTKKGTKSDVATSPLPSHTAQKRAEWLHKPCVLGVLQQEDKITNGRITLAFWGFQVEGGMAA